MDIELIAPNWLLLPDCILLQVFKYLNSTYMPIVARVCKIWSRISKDDLLWKKFFYCEFQLDEAIPIAPGRTSWRSEYERLVQGIAIVETEEISEHNHQVLHVSFSHNGEFFATSSKDGYIIVWRSNYPASVEHYRDMKVYSWKYTQFSQFNSTDTLLLVSGVHFGTCNSTSGEIAVFNLENDFQLQCRVKNKPYDIFGTWYNDNYLLSGDLRWLAQMASANIIWMNKAKQETSSEHESIINRLYRFYNRNASSVRNIMVANCFSPDELEESTQDDLHTQMQDKLEIPERGNPPSNIALEHQSSVNSYKGVAQEREKNTVFRSSILYTKDYRHAEQSPAAPSEDEDSADDDSLDSCGLHTPDWAMKYPPVLTLDNDDDKYLIFTTGSKTYSPHQIGFKRIRNFKIPTTVESGPTLKERIEHRDYMREMRNRGMLQQPDWLDYEAVAAKFDSIDHVIDVDGHIIGMGLSPDHRYLYVNSRPWPDKYMIDNPLNPPDIAEEIDIHVIDLVHLKKVGTMLRSHRAYTLNAECFFIFLDVSHLYVASGAEDKHGYMWDRHYGVCLARLQHSDVVNAVAFNPVDPEMLITVSDDHKIKVWRSRRIAKQLGFDLKTVNIGEEMRLKHPLIEPPVPI